MHTQLKAAIVRIFATKGYIVGMGFLVSERAVLSCAHVITAALRIPEDTPNPPTAPILLDFPLIAPDRYLQAHVSFWQPPQPNGGGDIAVLQLDDPLPADAEALGFVSAEDMWNRSRTGCFRLLWPRDIHSTTCRDGTTTIQLCSGSRPIRKWKIVRHLRRVVSASSQRVNLAAYSPPARQCPISSIGNGAPSAIRRGDDRDRSLD